MTPLLVPPDDEDSDGIPSVSLAPAAPKVEVVVTSPFGPDVVKVLACLVMPSPLSVLPVPLELTLVLVDVEVVNPLGSEEERVVTALDLKVSEARVAAELGADAEVAMVPKPKPDLAVVVDRVLETPKVREVCVGPEAAAGTSEAYVVPGIKF